MWIYEDSNPENKEEPTRFPEQTFKLVIHKSRDVADLWERVKAWLEAEFNFNKNRGQTMKLFYKGVYVEKTLSLQEAGITSDAKMYVQIECEDEQAKLEKAKKEAEELEAKTNLIKDELGKGIQKMMDDT